MIEYAILDAEDNVVRYDYYENGLDAKDIKHVNGKPLARPVVEENKEFNSATHVRSPTYELIVEDTQVKKVYTIREKNSSEILAMKNSKKQQIKEYAQNLIYQIMPQYKQINTLALGMEMSIQYGPDPNNWPGPVQTLNSQALAAWALIKNIRVASDIKELEVEALTDPQEIHDYDLTTGWD